MLTCSSFSKTIAPGYRIGWVVADHWRDDVIEWKQATSSAMCSLPQMAMADYLRSGEYERHLVRLRRAYRLQVEKCASCWRATCPRARVSAIRRADSCCGWRCRAGSMPGTAQPGAARKISLTPGMMFSATRKFRNFVRVNCGYPWDARIRARGGPAG